MNLLMIGIQLIEAIRLAREKGFLFSMFLFYKEHGAKVVEGLEDELPELRTRDRLVSCTFLANLYPSNYNVLC